MIKKASLLLHNFRGMLLLVNYYTSPACITGRNLVQVRSLGDFLKKYLIFCSQTLLFQPYEKKFKLLQVVSNISHTITCRPFSSPRELIELQMKLSFIVFYLSFIKSRYSQMQSKITSMNIDLLV